MRKFKLSEAQFGMLELLYRRGPMSQKELVQELGVSYWEIRRLVKQLVEKTLVARRRRDKDRRFIIIAISGYGRFQMEFAEPGTVWAMGEGVKKLSPEEQEGLREILDVECWILDFEHREHKGHREEQEENAGKGEESGLGGI